ncbi:MAG: PAS domain S-box protein [Deltaproteobacteria bacterium]|nr:PAS domain S-box protein [Deltaproteobacteria bacterium]
MEREKMTREELLCELALMDKRLSELEEAFRLLKKSEERHRNFIDSIDESCYEIDLDGKFTFVNERLALNAGTTKENVLGRSFRGRFLPEEAKRITRIYAEALRTGNPVKNLIYSYLSADGTTRIVENSSSIIQDADGRPVGFRGITRDVTDREERLGELERAKNFLDNVQDACFEVDLNGKYLFFNDAACRLMDSNREDMLKATSLDFFTPEMAQKVFKMYNRIYKTGEAAPHLEYDIITKNGDVRHLQASVSLIRDADGKPAGFRGITRDVTERREKESDLERYRAFFENIDDSIFELDLRGRFTLFNQATCRNMEYSPEELRSLPIRARYATKEEADEIFKMFNQVYQTGESVKALENKALTKNGQAVYFDLSISLLYDKLGKPAGFRCISRDITKRKMLEIEQEQLRERLAQAEKLESIGTLAGGIAHDFNNLLMGIQGYTSLMLLEMDPHHPNYNRLKAIENQVINGADLTRQLLGYARGGRYVVTATDLNELLGRTISVFSRTKREIRVYESYAQNLWKVDCDQGQMEQVFLNLFVNAWQAMPGGGNLYLESQNIVLDESYAKNLDCKPGSYVKISVTDTGMGMDERTRQRIFEPFFTTKEMSRGAGLGLASTYGIIKGHKGIINVYSEKGHGATFNIYLPAAESEAKKPEPPASQARTYQGTVLLVDDEKMIREVTGALLKRLGHQVITAESGREAIALYQADRERIDLVIMDMIMPEMGGGEAIDRLREMNPDVKVILSSGYSLNGEAKDILDRGGAQEFIQKPFSLDALSHKVQYILDMGH